MFEGLISAVFEAFFAGTGRRLLGSFGKRPGDIVSFVTGMAFWSVIGMLLYSIFG